MVVGVSYIWMIFLFKKMGIARIAIIPINIFIYCGQMVISLYYDYYSELPHFQLLTRISEAFEVRNQIYIQLFDTREWIIIVGCIGNIVFSFLLLNFETNRQKVFRVASLCIIICYGSYELMNFQRKEIHDELYYLGYSNISSSCGFTYAYMLMIQELIRSLEHPKVSYPGKINPQPHGNTVTRKPRQEALKNIIMIQVESLDKTMLFYEVADKKVMPFLSSLIPRSVFFENFIAQHSGGGSSDAELATLLSLLPLRSHSGLRTADYTRVTTLLQILKNYGYSSYAMHANQREFFNRAFTFAQMGFDVFYSRRDYKGAAKGLESKDLAFFKQSLEKISSLPAPYLVYLITMQSHGPFKNYSRETRLKFDFESHHTEMQIDGICAFHEVDQALKSFITQLDHFNILDQAVLLIFADESPSIFTPKKEFETIPLIIIDSTIRPHIEGKLGSHLDIAGTVTDLLGIPEADCWLGDSLLGPAEDRVVLLNNLSILRREGAEIVAQRDNRYKRFIDYSRSILE